MTNSGTPSHILKLYPLPSPGDYVVYDTAECYDDQEDQVGGYINLGFEPYAVTFAELDTRDDAVARMKLKGVPIYRVKRWFRRPRTLSANEVALINKEKV